MYTIKLRNEHLLWISFQQRIQIKMGDVKRECRYVRVVKETDLKSVGLRPRRFEPCCRRFSTKDFLISSSCKTTCDDLSHSTLSRSPNCKLNMSQNMAKFQSPTQVTNSSVFPSLTLSMLLLFSRHFTTIYKDIQFFSFFLFLSYTLRFYEIKIA